MGQINNDILNIIYRFHWISIIKQNNDEYHINYKSNSHDDSIRKNTCDFRFISDTYINFRNIRLVKYRTVNINKLGTCHKTGILPKNYY